MVFFAEEFECELDTLQTCTGTKQWYNRLHVFDVSVLLMPTEPSCYQLGGRRRPRQARELVDNTVCFKLAAVLARGRPSCSRLERSRECYVSWVCWSSS